MRTWAGIIGAGVVGLLALFILAATRHNETARDQMRFEDSGIVGSETSQPTEYETWRPDSGGLTERGTFGDGWEDDIIQDKNAAQKYKAPQNDPKAQPQGKPRAQEQKTVEYFNVGDMWKSDTPIQLTPSDTAPEEDAVKKTIRAFGNAVGAKIQMLVLSHGKQNENLGAFVIERTDSGRTYIDKLSSDYDTLAKNIESVDAPSVFKNEKSALIAGYRGIADGLRILKKSTDDASTYENMLTYNSHVETFGTSFIEFALLFKEQGVTFKENEPGGIFTPPVSQQ